MEIEFSVKPSESSPEVIRVCCPVADEAGKMLTDYYSDEYEYDFDTERKIGSWMRWNIPSLVLKYADKRISDDWIFWDNPKVAN